MAVVARPDLTVTTGNMGETSYQPPLLELDLNIPKEMLLEVILHEVLHHIDESHGGQFELNSDENKTKALAIALAPVIEQLKVCL